MRSFPASVLLQMDEQLEACGYRTHEFGDSVLIERLIKLIRGLSSAAII